MSKKLKSGWHVLYVKYCQEKKVHQQLQEKQLHSYLPIVKTIRQWSDRKKTIFKPLFPSYVFVNLISQYEFGKALTADGAFSYIRFGSEYATVSENEITQLKLFMGEGDLTDVTINSSALKIGDKRIIKRGALSGLECEIVKVDNLNKIIVRIESLQQNVSATIPSYLLSESLPAIL